ncbi:MAG TPA: hypothetical protein VGK30_06235 [Candidatus Binatia bacterium]|jgi:hypothetical protein
MQVRRRAHEWEVRWPIDHAATNGLPQRGARVVGSCRSCDADASWLELSDFHQMPPPSVVHRCARCGSATALAVLPITSRPWEESRPRGPRRYLAERLDERRPDERRSESSPILRLSLSRAL